MCKDINFVIFVIFVIFIYSSAPSDFVIVMVSVFVM